MYNGLKILESGESINRNIVECKLGPAAPDHAVVVRINRNIVECKLGPAAPDHAVVVRINRNIVECKCTYQLFHSPDLM